MLLCCYSLGIGYHPWVRTDSILSIVEEEVKLRLSNCIAERVAPHTADHCGTQSVNVAGQWAFVILILMDPDNT